jgi:sortase A
MTWIFASLLFVFGSWLIGQGAWIHIKAVAAQWLLKYAWEETLTTQRPVKPWPWADTWPVGRLLIPGLGIDQIILADASGQSLAFGPGKVRDGYYSDKESETLILSGHRDTHFSFIQDLQLGETLTIQTLQGEWRYFVVENTEVVDSRIESLPLNQEGSSLQLITCYPFDAVLPGGPLRYRVTAEPATPRAVFQTEALASDGSSKGRGMIVEGP